MPAILICLAALPSPEFRISAVQRALSPIPYALYPPPTDLAATIPDDALIVLFSRPLDDGPATAPATRPAGLPLAGVLSMLTATGAMPDGGQIMTDVAIALPALGRYPFALALLEFSVGRPDRAGLRLTDMHAALLVRTDGDNADILAQLSRMIRRHSNTQTARISEHKTTTGRFHRLVDDRLPPWAVLEWGPAGPFFAIAVGEGVFGRLAAVRAADARPLSKLPWFAAAHSRVDGAAARLECYIDFQHLRERLSAAAENRLTDTLDVLGASDIERDLWTFGALDRGLTCFRLARRAGRDQFTAYADPVSVPADLRRRIPAAAGRYAVVRGATRWLLEQLPAACITALYHNDMPNVRRFWRELQETGGFDVERDLFDHLGEHVIVCDAPAHPLGLPFALTIAIEIDDAAAVRACLDRLLTGVAAHLDQRAARHPDRLVRLKIARDPDGVWYLQAGLLGPAVTVTDRYILASWSPQALRQALLHFRDGEPPKPQPVKNER